MKKKNLLYIVCALAMGSLCGCDDFLNAEFNLQMQQNSD